MTNTSTSLSTSDSLSQLALIAPTYLGGILCLSDKLSDKGT
ncbi:hypothetical protein [Nostoc sp. CHAB 5836]|nr:hypothetical protein [Nostoc sp. CHAB 5836]